jgi:hypothetical protein
MHVAALLMRALALCLSRTWLRSLNNILQQVHQQHTNPRHWSLHT